MSCLLSSYKKREKMEWSTKCNEAFEQLKGYITKASLLSTSQEGDVLYLYLAVSKWATSAGLVREEAGTQHPVY